MNDPHQTFVVKKRPWIGAAISVAACLVALALLVYGIFSMSGSGRSDDADGNWRTGTISKKLFRPAPDTEISVGAGGLNKREVAGDWLFEVTTGPEDETRTVYVDRSTYGAYDVGDRFRFLLPPTNGE